MAKAGPKGPSKYTQEFIENEAVALEEYTKTSIIPFLKEFTYMRGYPSQTVSEVFVFNQRFSDALKKLKDIQEYKLCAAALARKVDTAMAIFCLKNVSGWRDLPMDKEDEKLKNTEISFSSVPSNGDGKGRLAQYFD